jgi:hypothetical protein
MILLPVFCSAVGNDAEFLNQSVPFAMIAGQRYLVSVTMKNTGAAAWTTMDNYRLGSQNPQDNGIWREGRVYFDSGDAIASNQTKTFNFAVKAPLVSGTYNFQWQMLREGVEWFGDKTSNMAISVFDFCVPNEISDCKICKNDGRGWIDDDSRCGVGKICRNGVCAVAEVPLSRDLFLYGVFSGANILQKSSCWIPDKAQAAIILAGAKKIGLNILRLPILVQAANNDDCWGMPNIKIFLDKAYESNIKVIIVLDGYSKYEGKCGWKQGFVDVKAGAAKIVAAFKDHPALFAWDLVNEPLWGADNSGCSSGADHISVIKAVNAMHDLVRSIDSKTPLTVGEGNDEYLSQWNDIVNFASPHIYFGGDYRFTKDEFKKRIDYLKIKAGLRPLIIGEFGIAVPPWEEMERKQKFKEIYEAMKEENAGGMFWLLSTDEEQSAMSLIDSGGFLKPTAETAAICFSKDCFALRYKCGTWSDGCGATLNCGACAIGQACNDRGQCVVSASGGGNGGSGIIIENKKEETTPVAKLTRAQILQKIAQIKQLLIKLIAQLIVELQKQAVAMQK